MDPIERLLHPVAVLTRRSLRWEGVSLALSLAVVAVFAAPARAGGSAAAALLAYGVGLAAHGVGLRASGRVLTIARAPVPGWIAWAAPLYVAAGVVVVTGTAALLTGVWHPAR
jgi:hypothetical protein